MDEQPSTTMSCQTPCSSGRPRPADRFKDNDHVLLESPQSPSCHKNKQNDGPHSPPAGALPSSQAIALPSSSSVRREPIKSLLEDNGRDRLKKLRMDVAGRVRIPDIWGQEGLLDDWVDCGAFDASLVHRGIMSARAALMEEGRRTSSGRLRIKTRV